MGMTIHRDICPLLLSNSRQHLCIVAYTVIMPMRQKYTMSRNVYYAFLRHRDIRPVTVSRYHIDRNTSYNCQML